MKKMNVNPVVLSIAGSDPSAGAGLQADLKTISALGGYACTAISALTVQNTQGVRDIQAVSGEFLTAQCVVIFEDIHVDAVKIGMLPNRECIEAVHAVLQKYQPEFVVWDPVLAATSGVSLVTEDVTQNLIDDLLPLVHIITPNLDELAILTHSKEALNANEALAKIQGYALLHRGARAVLVKGGHLEGNLATDWLIMQDMEESFTKKRIETQNTHGSGCTLSSAIACLRPQFPNLSETIRAAKNYVQAAIKDAQHWHLGHGHGPLAHFHDGTGHYVFSAEDRQPATRS